MSISNTNVDYEDLYAYDKIMARAEELAKKWLEENDYDVKGFESVSEFNRDGCEIFFVINWQSPDFTDTDIYETFYVSYPIEDFLHRKERKCTNCKHCTSFQYSEFFNYYCGFTLKPLLYNEQATDCKWYEDVENLRRNLS